VENGADPQQWFEAFFNNDDMTDALCYNTCNDAGYSYFAIAYGRDCWCSQTAPTGTSDPTQCTYPNSGSTLANPEIGGSDTAVSVFSISAAPGTITPIDNNGPGGTTTPIGISPLQGGDYIGCLAAGTLSGQGTQDPAQTQELCQTTCAAYKFFAIGNGDTCYCDNSVAFGDIAPYPPNAADSGPGDAQLNATES
jgi:hypothetical protein